VDIALSLLLPQEGKKEEPSYTFLSTSHSRIIDFIIGCLGLLLKLIALHESPAVLLLPGIQGSLKGFLSCFLTGEICEKENFLLPRGGRANLA